MGKIRIEFDAYDENRDSSETAGGTGLTALAHDNIIEGLAQYGDDIEITEVD